MSDTDISKAAVEALKKSFRKCTWSESCGCPFCMVHDTLTALSERVEELTLKLAGENALKVQLVMDDAGELVRLRSQREAALGFARERAAFHAAESKRAGDAGNDYWHAYHEGCHFAWHRAATDEDIWRAALGATEE